MGRAERAEDLSRARELHTAFRVAGIQMTADLVMREPLFEWHRQLDGGCHGASPRCEGTTTVARQPEVPPVCGPAARSTHWEHLRILPEPRRDSRRRAVDATR